jgi:SOS response regulatory protein OraA/RecX
MHGAVISAQAATAAAAAKASQDLVDAQLAAMQQNTAMAAAAKAQNQQNAIEFLTSTFNDYGLGGDIASAVTNLVQQGYNADTIQLMAQDPKGTDPLAVAFASVSQQTLHA